MYDFIITCYRFFTNFRLIYCSLNNFNYLSVLIVCNNIYPTTIFIKKYYAYYNQYKNGIDIAFDDNVLLFVSCAEAEKNLHTTPNSQRLIDNLAIDEPLKYAALALDCELQNWSDAMDTNWDPY